MIRVDTTKALPCSVCGSWRLIGEPCLNCESLRWAERIENIVRNLEILTSDRCATRANAERIENIVRNLEAAPF